MKFIGIDIGSTCAKTVVMNENKEIVLEFVQPTGWSSVDTAEEIRKKLVENDADPAENVCVATGYGRVSVPYADKMITEITCHAMGAVWIFDNKDMTIIDIGGQDSKVIRLDENGAVANFVMNDKCAAGTGRFFEAMAKAFEMDLSEFSKLSLKAKNVIPITAQCTVFAESEVISLVGEGKPMDEIAAGIELSVAKRCFVMSKKAGAVDSITLTGGCAKNEGLKEAIEKVLNLKVIDLPIDPQLMGALGAAEFARQKGMAKEGAI